MCLFTKMSISLDLADRSPSLKLNYSPNNGIGSCHAFEERENFVLITVCLLTFMLLLVNSNRKRN